jgi:hypothetical protein
MMGRGSLPTYLLYLRKLSTFRKHSQPPRNEACVKGPQAQQARACSFTQSVSSISSKFHSEKEL